jgi:hypothetical protein
VVLPLECWFGILSKYIFTKGQKLLKTMLNCETIIGLGERSAISSATFSNRNNQFEESMENWALEENENEEDKISGGGADSGIARCRL